MELSEKTKRNFFILLWAGFLIPVIAVFIILFMIGTGHLGYIPDFDENRNKIATLDRTNILESILREYLK